MPIGQHLTTCLHCGNSFTCGDCILTTCDSCRKAGHTGDWSTGCMACWVESTNRTLKAAAPQCAFTLVYQSKHHGDAPVFKEYRADGWPLCPFCGEDELYSFRRDLAIIVKDTIEPPTPAEIRAVIAEYIDAGLRCYRCNWELPAKPVMVNLPPGNK